MIPFDVVLFDWHCQVLKQVNLLRLEVPVRILKRFIDGTVGANQDGFLGGTWAKVH